MTMLSTTTSPLTVKLCMAKHIINAVVLLDGNYSCKSISEYGMKGGVVLLTSQIHGRGEEILHRERIPKLFTALIMYPVNPLSVD